MRAFLIYMPPQIQRWEGMRGQNATLNCYRCKNTILSEHYARGSTYFLSWDVESTVSRFFGRDVRNDVE